jgi:hypothetical protein
MHSESTYISLGRKLTDKYIRNNINLCEIENCTGENLVEKLYNHFHPEPHVCATCGQPTEFVSFSKGYREYCSRKCLTKSPLRKERTIQTCIKKYGRAFPKDIEKSKQTCLERYGTEHASQNDKIKQKSKQTCLERYGQETGLNIEKSKQTCLERYGTEHASQNPATIKRIKQTKLERYGDSGYNNRTASIQTCLERYGTEHASQNDKIRLKIQSTMRSRYGADTWAQSEALKSHGDIISAIGDQWICKCPHPDCNKCTEKLYQTTPQIYRDRKRHSIELCTNILTIGTNHESYIEKYIRTILDEHNIKYIQHSFKIIPPLQLDFYLPDYNMGIECNGIFWHSDKCKPPQYQSDKYKKCVESGIRLISIWEDWVANSPDIVRSILLSKLGIYKTRIGARQCAIKKLSQHEIDIIMQHHIQGTCKMSRRYGLIYKGKLVAAMGFGKKRRGMMGSIERDESYELARFCTLPGLQIVGGAGKLLKRFIKDVQPSSITSFSSNDISDGRVYERLGFEKVSENQSYWIVDKKMHRWHRYKFRKSELIKRGYSANLTEREIVNQMGFYRIYDTGQAKWILKCS